MCCTVAFMPHAHSPQTSPLGSPSACCLTLQSGQIKSSILRPLSRKRRRKDKRQEGRRTEMRPDLSALLFLSLSYYCYLALFPLVYFMTPLCSFSLYIHLPCIVLPPESAHILIPAPLPLSLSLFCFHLPPSSPEGDRAGSSGIPAGAAALRPSAGPGVDPHPVSVRGAGGLWHGLPGAEEVHPPGPGSQVGSRQLMKTGFKLSTFYFLHFVREIVFFFSTGVSNYLYYPSLPSTQKFTGYYKETWPKSG